MSSFPYLAWLARFNLRVPIMQAPTGSIAGPELATAICRAGAMGALALTWTTPEDAVSHIRQIVSATGGPFQVNFALHFPPNALNAALDAGVGVVTFSWGDASAYVARCHAANAHVGVQVTSAEGAKRAIGSGADFVICQGVEAGGHVQSTTRLFDLLPRVVAASEGVPVLAAGGLATGADIADVLKSGASAAVLGTRFVAAGESRAHDEYKRQIVASGPDSTALTVCFEGGWPYAAHRVLRNATLERWEAAGSPPVGRRPGESDVVGHTAGGEAILRYEDTAPRVGMTGEVGAMCLYAGTGSARINDVPPAGELVARLWREAQDCLLDIDGL